MHWLRRTVAETLVPRMTAVLVPLAAAALVLGQTPRIVAAPLSAPVDATVILVEDAPAAASARDATHVRDLAEIRGILSGEEAAQRLAEAGLTVDAAMARVEKMTPAETHYLVQRLREDRHLGGDGLGLLIAVLVIVLLVVLIILLLDKTIEIKDKGTHSQRDVKSSQPVAKGAVLD